MTKEQKSYRQLAKDWSENTNVGWIRLNRRTRLAVKIFGEYLDSRKYRLNHDKRISKIPK